MQFLLILYYVGLYMIGYGIEKLFLNYTAVLNFDLGTSRAVNSNENTQGTENTNKHILVAEQLFNW